MGEASNVFKTHVGTAYYIRTNLVCVFCIFRFAYAVLTSSGYDDISSIT